VLVGSIWPEGRGRRPVSVLIDVGASVGLVGSSIRLWAEAWVLDVTTSTLWDFRSGKAWWALFGISAVGLVAEPLVRSRTGRRWLLVVAVALVVAAGAAIAFAGHAASGRAPALGALTTVAHVAAAAVWIGGLAALVACVMVAGSGEATAVARQFSRVAVWCVVAVVTTGAVQSVRQLRSVDAITDSDFGVTLLVKLGLVALLLIVARWSRAAVGQLEADDDDAAQRVVLRRLVGVEVGLAVLVFGATGWLAGASPIVEANAAQPIEVSITDTTGEATVALTITPGAAGPNSAVVNFLDLAAGLPDEVTMQMEAVDGSLAPIDVDVTSMGDHAMASFQIPFSGEWRVRIDARYGDFDLRTYESIVTVD
jgi:copper transport protein